MIDHVSRRQRRVAASTVEFALASVVFFPLVLGIIEIGRGLMVGHILTVAAARGCRAAAIEGTSNDDVSAAVAATMTKGGISGHSISVQVNDQTANASTAKAGDAITVVVSIPVSKVTWIPGGTFILGNLSAQYTLLRE